MHPAGFEPAMSFETDYESGAFDHSATDADKEIYQLLDLKSIKYSLFLGFLYIT